MEGKTGKQSASRFSGIPKTLKSSLFGSNATVLLTPTESAEPIPSLSSLPSSATPKPNAADVKETQSPSLSLSTPDGPDLHNVEMLLRKTADIFAVLLADAAANPSTADIARDLTIQNPALKEAAHIFLAGLSDVCAQWSERAPPMELPVTVGSVPGSSARRSSTDIAPVIGSMGSNIFQRGKIDQQHSAPYSESLGKSVGEKEPAPLQSRNSVWRSSISFGADGGNTKAFITRPVSMMFDRSASEKADKFLSKIPLPIFHKLKAVESGFFQTAGEIRAEYRTQIQWKSDIKNTNSKLIYAVIRNWRLLLFGSEKSHTPFEEIDLSQTIACKQGSNQNTLTILLVNNNCVSCFYCKDLSSRDKFYFHLLDTIQEATSLMETSLVTKNTTHVHQGFLVLLNESLELTPQILWCFVYDGSFGYFQGNKTSKVINLSSLVDLTLVNPRVMRMTCDSVVYHWMASSDQQMIRWHSCLSESIRIERATIEADGQWKGYLTKREKSILQKDKEYWFSLNQGKLFCFKSAKESTPLSIHDLHGASVVESGHLEIRLILVDSTSIRLSSDSTRDFDHFHTALKKNIAHTEVDNQSYIRSGNLNIAKMNPNNTVKSEPKLYWIVLRKDSLLWYKNAADPTPKNIHNISEIQIPSMRLDAREDFFSVHIGKKIFRMIATNHVLAVQWRDDIKRAINSFHYGQESTQTANARPSRHHNTLHSISQTVTHQPKKLIALPSSRKINLNKLDETPNEELGYALHEMAKVDSTLPTSDGDIRKTRRNSISTQLTHQRSKAPTGDILIFDNGSSFIRAGFNRSPYPSLAIPSIVWYQNATTSNEFCVGFKALQQEESIGSETRRPFQAESSINWDSMADMYSHIIECEFDIEVPNHPIVLTKPAGYREEEYENILELFIEGFEAPAVFLCDPGPLPVFSLQKSTGISVDIGTRTQITPVYDNTIVPDGCLHSNIGGLHVDSYLGKIVTQDLGMYIPPTKAQRLFSSMKESICYISQDYEKELQQWACGSAASRNISYTIDNHVKQIGSHRFRAAEILFDPKIGGYDAEGVAELIQRSVSKCDIHLRKDLCQNIVVSGGSTLIPGFVDRLRKELNKTGNAIPPVKIHAQSNRKYAHWYGAQNIATNPNFGRLWFTADQYWEDGCRADGADL